MSRPAVLALRNIAKAALLYGAFVLGLTALGWWLGGTRLATLSLVVALLMAATVYWYGPRIILASLGARELLLADAPPVWSAAERLAAAAGVARPKLYLLPGGHPRALSVGRGVWDTGIALSEGLLTVARPAELEAVLAHELAHARHRDVLVQTPVVLIAGWIVEVSRIAGFLERAFLSVLAPLAASLVHVFLSTKRELAADRFAARVCGTPHGMADALIRLEQTQELLAFRASPVTEPLYIVNPFPSEGLPALFETHPPIGERVERLRGLDPDWREKLRAA